MCDRKNAWPSETRMLLLFDPNGKLRKLSYDRVRIRGLIASATCLYRRKAGDVPEHDHAALDAQIHYHRPSDPITPDKRRSLR